jgi:hypothetical protein
MFLNVNSLVRMFLKLFSCSKNMIISHDTVYIQYITTLWHIKTASFLNEYT